MIHFIKNYKNIEFVFGDAKNIIEKHMNDKRCFMFLDPPFLLTTSFYKMPSLNYFFELLKNVNEVSTRILAVCGEHDLLLCFYAFYKIKIKFETTMNYRGNPKNQHQNVYVSNY